VQQRLTKAAWTRDMDKMVKWGPKLIRKTAML